MSNPRKRRKLGDEGILNVAQPDRSADEDRPNIDEAFLKSIVTRDLEADYEKRRRQRREPDEFNRLPVKTPAGRLQASTLVPEVVEERSSSDESSEPLARDTPPTDDSGHIEDQHEPQLSSEERLIKAKEELSRLAAQLSEDPERNIGNLKGLAQITLSRDAIVTKLGLATQVQVYKDIIPSYRIRALTKDDLKEKVSKDVRTLR